MKKFSVQVENLNMLNEALNSDCNDVRFGSDFCEWKIPSLAILKKAYRLVNDAGKNFTYVTPLVASKSLDKLEQQINFLAEEKKMRIVVNDLGVLRLVKHHLNLKPHLGRILITIPSRCPWPQITELQVDERVTNEIAKIFYQTSLNSELTLNILRNHGIQNFDVEWIPSCFPHLTFPVDRGFTPSIHLHLILVVITRRCHTARLLGEKNPQECSRPCYVNAFSLKQKTLDMTLFLHGNVAFRIIQPTRQHVNELIRLGVAEFIIAMNPVTGIESGKKVNTLIHSLT